MRKFGLSFAALALALPAVAVTSVPASAHGRYAYKEWRGSDGRTYCRRPNGTVGLVVGGVAGALVGRAVDTRGDRAVGTILGAGAGALLGREIQRGRRCR